MGASRGADLLLHGADDGTIRPEHMRGPAAPARTQGLAARDRYHPGVKRIGIPGAVTVPARSLGLAGGPVLEDIRRWPAGLGLIAAGAVDRVRSR